MFQSLRGKVAIVTGSSSGIGEAIAVKMAAARAKVAICGRDTQRTQNVMARCVEVSGGQTGRFISLCGDLKDSTFRDSIVDRTVEHFGKLDILVANAGIADRGAISTGTEERYDLVMNTNLKSVYFLIQRSLPHLEKTRGNIVCVSSIGTTFPFPSGEVYQMSKAGLDTLVRSLAFSQAPKGIRVNATNPGPVRTRITRELGPEHKGSVTEPLVQYTVQGRVIHADEQANAVLFLASNDQASSITGQCLKVDGGMSLGNTRLIDMRKELEEKMRLMRE